MKFSDISHCRIDPIEMDTFPPDTEVVLNSLRGRYLPSITTHAQGHSVLWRDIIHLE